MRRYHSLLSPEVDEKTPRRKGRPKKVEEKQKKEGACQGFEEEVKVDIGPEGRQLILLQRSF